MMAPAELLPPLRTLSSPGTASTLGTLGSRGDNWFGATAMVELRIATATVTAATYAATRHRHPGNSRPSGKSRIVTPRKTMPSMTVLPNTDAGHSTQLRIDAPLSRPRMATKSLPTEIPFDTLIASRDH